MKILIISTVELSKNGITNSIMSYYRAILKQRNYEIDFLYTGFIDESLKDEILNNEGQIFCFGNRKRRPLHYISLLRNLAINKKYDYVWVHGNSSSMAFEEFALRNLDSKIIVQAHSVITNYSFLNKILRRYFLNHFDLGLAVSKEAGTFLFKNKQFHILPNGLSIKNYYFSENSRMIYREKYKISSETTLIIQLATYTAMKNHKFSLELAQKLKEKGINFKLLCFGYTPFGNLKKELESEVENNNLENHVTLFDSIDDIKGILSATDGVIIPSTGESFGIVALESQAAGVPVVVSSEHFIPELKISSFIDYLPLEVEKWAKWVENLKIKEHHDSTIGGKAIIQAGLDDETIADYFIKLIESIKNK
ncbi:glycosyltransferase [Streptococcus thermophilus]|nr:glycosyltransferase [Streptococcus thermophilus]